MKTKRKQFEPKIPMMRSTRQEIALRMHLMAEAMVLTPTATTANELSKAMAVMTEAVDHASHVRIGKRDDPVALSLVASLQVMCDIEERHEQIGKWGVTGEQAKVIRAAAARFDEALARIPYNVYLAAREFVELVLAREAGMAWYAQFTKVKFPKPQVTA